MKSENFFIKKANQRKLNRFQENSSLSFACGASAFMGAACVALSYDMKTKALNPVSLGVAGLFLAEALLALLLWSAFKSQVLKKGDVSRGLRLAGSLLVATIVNGNIFCALAGLSLVKKKKNLEYQVGSYMLLVEILIIIVSYLNVFKDYVCDSFFLGMGVLAVVIVIHAVSLPLVAAHVHGNRAD